MEFVLSEKGRNKLKLNGFLFTVDRECKDGRIYWRCEHYRRKKCKSRVITINEQVENNETPHNHPADPIHVGKQRIIAELKENAIEQNTASLHGIVCGKLHTVSENVLATLPPLQSVKRTLRRVQTTVDGDPPVPETMEDLFIPDYLRYTERDKPFLMFDSGTDDPNRILIFTTKRNLSVLAMTQNWLADGTFDDCPSPFKQLYTIHGLVDGTTIPLVYALLPGKSTPIYSKFLLTLDETLKPETIMVDMELAFVNAVRSRFRGIKIRYCSFHLSQAVYRKLGTYHLKTRYDQDEAFCMKVKCLLSLMYVPPIHVVQRFEELLATEFLEEDNNIDDFLLSFEKQYIGSIIRGNRRREPRYAIEDWNHYSAVFADLPRTNNSVEGWHRGFSEIVSRKNANIWHILKCLRKEQSKNEMIIAQLRSGVTMPPPKKKYVRFNDQIRSIVHKYYRPMFNNKMDYVDAIARIISI